MKKKIGRFDGNSLLKQQGLQAENEALKERVKQLEEALLPLVKLSDAVFVDTRKDKQGVLYAFNAAEITYNDLRSAKQALNTNLLNK